MPTLLCHRLRLFTMMYLLSQDKSTPTVVITCVPWVLKLVVFKTDPIEVI